MVEYESYESAKLAIEGTNDTEFYDKTIKCDFAFVRGPTRAGRVIVENGGIKGASKSKRQ